MKLSDLEVDLHNLVRRANRPLILILTLDHVMNYKSGDEKKEYSFILKSCFFFYKFAIDDREMFETLKSFSGINLECK